MPLPIALQLYTVRDPLKQDFEGTLAQVAQIGFRYIEGGVYGLEKAAEVKQTLQRLGLRMAGGMTGLEAIRDKLDEVVAEAQFMDYHYVTLGSVGDEWRHAEGYAKAAEILAEAHRRAAPRGVTICYHNHSFEFAPLPGGGTGMEAMYANPGLHAELDVYWVTHGNQDPVAWLRRLSGRVPLLHVKDMEEGTRNFTEVGTGTVPVAALVQAAPAAGVQFLIIEQDTNWKGGPLASAKTSFENLSRMAEGV